MGPLLANGALCLSTSKHNGKSSTEYEMLWKDINTVVLSLEFSFLVSINVSVMGISTVLLFASRLKYL